MEEVDSLDEANKPILLQIGFATIVFRLASQEVTNCDSIKKDFKVHLDWLHVKEVIIPRSIPSCDGYGLKFMQTNKREASHQFES